MSTTYPIEITLATLQEALRATHDVVWQELGRDCDLSNPDDNAQAVLFEMALEGKSHLEMRALLRASDEWRTKRAAEIAVIYREELGRDPDAGGLAGYLQGMRDGLSLAGVRQRIHDSAEAIAYRETRRVGRPIVGRLRVVPTPLNDPAYPDAIWHPLADDTGLRRLVGCTNFCAIRDLHDGNPVALTDLDTAAKAGYQLYLCYRALGFDGDGTQDTGYFRGRGVSPLWLPTDLPALAKEADRRRLGLVLSCGHKNVSTAGRLTWERAWMEALVAHGLAHVVKVVIGDNEFWQNADFHASDEQIEVYRQLQALLAQYLPDTLFACGAPENESTDKLRQIATAFAQVVDVHISRDVDKMTRRAFNCVYDDSRFSIHKHYQFGEPTPFAGGPDDFMPTDSPGRQVAQAAIGQLVGGTHIYFDGWDVRSPEPLDADAPTFHTIPQFLSKIPEDVAKSRRVPNAKIWWWEFPDGRLATVFDEQWAPQSIVLAAPVGVTLGHWTAYGPGNGTIEGRGNTLYETLPKGYGGALLISERA